MVARLVSGSLCLMAAGLLLVGSLFLGQHTPYSGRQGYHCPSGRNSLQGRHLVVVRWVRESHGSSTGACVPPKPSSEQFVMLPTLRKVLRHVSQALCTPL